jgi:hypothetical protein
VRRIEFFLSSKELGQLGRLGQPMQSQIDSRAPTPIATSAELGQLGQANAVVTDWRRIASTLIYRDALVELAKSNAKLAMRGGIALAHQVRSELRKAERWWLEGAKPVSRAATPFTAARMDLDQFLREQIKNAE